MLITPQDSSSMNTEQIVRKTLLWLKMKWTWDIGNGLCWTGQMYFLLRGMSAVYISKWGTWVNRALSNRLWKLSILLLRSEEFQRSKQTCSMLSFHQEWNELLFQPAYKHFWKMLQIFLRPCFQTEQLFSVISKANSLIADGSRRAVHTKAVGSWKQEFSARLKIKATKSKGSKCLHTLVKYYVEEEKSLLILLHETIIINRLKADKMISAIISVFDEGGIPWSNVLHLVWDF